MTALRRGAIRWGGALLLALTALSSVQADNRNAVQHYKKAMQLLDSEQWDAALKELKSAVEENPRSGKIQIGMFREPYYPYFQMALAYLGKGDLKASEKYFSMEESEGKIQKDASLYPRFQRERGEAQSAGAASPPPPAGGGAPSTVTASGGAPPVTENPAPATHGASAPATPASTGTVPAPPPPPADVSGLLGEARAAGERLGSFETDQGAALEAADRQKLATLRKMLETAFQSNDPVRLKNAGAELDRSLARIRVRMAGDFLKKRASFMSHDREEMLRSLGEQVGRAADAGDGAALPEAAKQLDERLGEARRLADQAIAAVRAAFAGAAEGDGDKAIRPLQEALDAQQDCPALRLILANFYFEAAAGKPGGDDSALARAREHAEQAFRLRPDLNLPERYFSPQFLEMVFKVTGRKSSKRPAGPKPAAPTPS